MARRRFADRHFVELLRRIDDELDAPATVIVIGGAALSLVAVPDLVTEDLDVMSTRQAHFWAAVDRARSKMEDPPPVQAVSIAQPPYHYEDRLQRFRGTKLKNLVVLVPELHDLALMKVARGDEKDLQMLEALHKLHRLSLAKLILAYDDSRTQVIGDPRAFRWQFLALVARLFGPAKADELDRELR